MTREDKLFKEIRAGNISAIDELIEMYYAEILKFCVWHTPSKEIAEDATQETFLKAIRYLDSYTHTGRFRAFLYKIALNVCIDINRKSKEDILENFEENSIYIENGFTKVESQINFKNLIHSLPDKQKEIVILRFVQDLTIREIAEITGHNLRTVQSSLKSALKKIEKNIKKEGGR